MFNDNEPQEGDLSDDMVDSTKDHPSYEQVMLDVSRCAASKEKWLKEKLAKLIVKLLIKNPDLHYYQGFHDVCLTYMMLLGEESALEKLNDLIDTHFKTFMQPTMDATQDFLALIPVIIGLQDSKVQKFLDESEVGTIFALSWVITWFSHVLPNKSDVEKIFKFLEEKDSHLILYLCAAIVLTKRESLLALEPEMSTVHHYLCELPKKEKLPIDKLLSNAVTAYVKFPPDLARRRLDSQRQAKLRLQNYTIISTLSNRFVGPLISLFDTKTAIVVFVIASALALQFDRWTR